MNKEKYSDPTAEKAIAHYMREKNRKNKNCNKNEAKFQRKKQ